MDIHVEILQRPLDIWVYSQRLVATAGSRDTYIFHDKGLDEVTRKSGVNKDKYSEDCTLRHSNIQKSGRWGKANKAEEMVLWLKTNKQTKPRENNDLEVK